MVDASVQPDETAGSPSAEMAATLPPPRPVDFFLEESAAGTTLRLVHSGFGPEANLDGEYTAVTNGWRLYLASLRSHLETQPGQTALGRLVTIPTELPAAEIWSRLVSAQGQGTEGLVAGASYQLRIADNETLAVEILMANPPNGLAVTVRDLNQARLLIFADEFGGQCLVNLQLYAVGLAADPVDAWLERLRASLADRLAVALATA